MFVKILTKVYGGKKHYYPDFISSPGVNPPEIWKSSLNFSMFNPASFTIPAIVKGFIGFALEIVIIRYTKY